MALYLSVYVYFMKVAVSSTLHTDLIFSPSAIFSLFSGVEDLEDLSHMLHIPPCHDVCLHSDKKSCVKSFGSILTLGHFHSFCAFHRWTEMHLVYSIRNNNTWSCELHCWGNTEDKNITHHLLKPLLQRNSTVHLNTSFTKTWKSTAAICGSC